MRRSSRSRRRSAPNRPQGRVFTREFPLRIKCRGVEMRFDIDAPDRGRPIPIRRYSSKSSGPAAALTPCRPHRYGGRAGKSRRYQLSVRSAV